MHVACLYLHYHNPDCASSARAYSVLKHLTHRHSVTLLTSTVWHCRRLTRQFDWVPSGVDVHMLDVPYENTMGAFKRLGAYLAFPAWALIKGVALSDLDVVYGISTPLTTAIAAASLARWHHVPWVLEVRDLWPDFPIQMGAVPFEPLQRALYGLERLLYRSAAHVITVSPDMTEHVRACGLSKTDVSTLPPGTDRALIEDTAAPSPETLRQQHGLEGREVILYAGTLGRANDIPTLIQVAERLQKERPTLAFVFVGHGHHEPDVRAAARRLNNILLIPPQPHHQMFSWFKIATLSIISFIDRPVLATNAPAKFFDSLTVGTPVIVTNAGWTKDFVDRHQCGWYVPASHPAQLADRIVRLLDTPQRLQAAGTRGMQVAQRHFDRNDYASGVTSIIESAATDTH